MKKNLQDYELINKSIFFKKQGILAFGDLHLGYEQMLKEHGFSFPFNQLEDTINDIKRIIEKIKSLKFRVKKIIILGDFKHYFGFEKEEKFRVGDLLAFLEKCVDKKNIILIKGNHERVKILPKEYKYRNYYINKNIIFVHGDKIYKELFDKKIKTIVIGHLHPAISLTDKSGVKKEKYKCFLTGKWKSKNVVILPSFLNLVEGTIINGDYERNNEGFCMIPKQILKDFDVSILGKEKIYDFGKLKDS